MELLGDLDHAPRGYDAVFSRIRFAAKFLDHDAVHAHLSAQNQQFGVTARGNSRTRNNFLKPFKLQGMSPVVPHASLKTALGFAVGCACAGFV